MARVCRKGGWLVVSWLMPVDQHRPRQLLLLTSGRGLSAGGGGAKLTLIPEW